jgi:hypothetical protein
MSMTVSLTTNDTLAESAVSAARAGLRDGAELIRGLSDPNVPVEFGDLVGSSAVDQDGDEAAVGYSGIAPDGYDYGIRQHEDMALNHPNGGTPKFLENALHEGAERALAAVAVPVARILG